MIEPVTIGRATHRWTAIYSFEEHGGEVRYVGKTSRYLIDRRKSHLTTSALNGKLPVNRWLKKRKENGGFVTRLLEHVEPGSDWAAREKFWIMHFRARGDRLLNLTDGGEGLAGHNFSEDHRRKISQALRAGAYFNCETCGAQFWRKPRDIGKGHNRFCSRPCYAASLTGVSRPVSDICIQRGVEAAAAEKRSRTHCKRNHPLSGGNLFMTKQGARGCKECRKLHKLAYMERKRG